MTAKCSRFARNVMSLPVPAHHSSSPFSPDDRGSRVAGRLVCLLFAGSKIGSKRAAAIYSSIETCKLNGAEPQAYMTDVLQKITENWPNSHLEELMQWTWSKPNQQKAT
jgi:hypothetical protein